jgi:uncharacterized membrane protein YheB (UPF0754 family)
LNSFFSQKQYPVYFLWPFFATTKNFEAFMNPWLFLIPFLSALLGWIIHSLAISLFLSPEKLAKIMGDAEGNRSAADQPPFAQTLARVAARELISVEEIQQKISDPANLKKVMPLVESHIDNFLRNKLQTALPMIAMFVGEKTIQQLKSVFMAELEEIFPQVMKDYVQQLGNEKEIEETIAKKIASIPPQKIQSLLKELLHPYFRSLKIIGAIAGFLIGILQLLILYLVS